MSAADDATGAARDGAALALYDGDCGMCARVATALARRGCANILWRPWQREARLPAGIAPGRLVRELVLVDARGQVLGGAAAFAVIFAGTPGLRWLGHALRLPGIAALGRLAYAMVARHRARISRVIGARACSIPPAPAGPVGVDSTPGKE